MFIKHYLYASSTTKRFYKVMKEPAFFLGTLCDRIRSRILYYAHIIYHCTGRPAYIDTIQFNDF